jgi:hypothetical protein
VRLLDTSGRGGGLAGSLGSKLLTGSLATSGLTCEVEVSKVKLKRNQREEINSRAVCLVRAIVDDGNLMGK